jgi:rod shape determining protein RodA
MINYKDYNIDFYLLFFCIFLSLVGIFNLYSAAPKAVFLKQLIWLFLGIIIMILMSIFNYKFLKRYAYYIFLFCGLLLFILLFNEKTVGGTKRWLSFSGFSFQPSELAKISLCIALAKYFSKKPLLIKYNFKDLFFPLIFTFLYMYLIFLEPNLSTSILLCLIFFTTLLFLRINFSIFLYLTGFTLLISPLFWFFLLRDYQKERIISFFNTGSDPLGTGYHIIQSKIALGSGSLFGKGFLSGTQSKLRFLPEQYTDFAFSVFAEEWGFLGCMIIILLYFGILYKCIKIVNELEDVFGIILVTSLASIFFWQFFINICMTVDLLPVVGMPLPFISYGGSSLVSSFIIIGIILNIKNNRFLFSNYKQ